MRRVALVVAVCLSPGIPLFADSVTFSSGSSLVALGSSGFSSGQTDPLMGVQGSGPFWNNWSTDTSASLGCASNCSHDMNIGYMLTDSGGFSGSAPVLGVDSVSQALLGAGGADPVSFLFNQTGDPYTTTLLGAYSSLDTPSANSPGTVFGWYYIDPNTGMPVLIPLYSAPGFVTAPESAQAFNNTLPQGVTEYGFYATVCYGVTCTNSNEETYFTDSTLNRGVLTTDGNPYASFNHFALFTLSSGNTHNFVIGFKDGPLTTEGMGDFNDIVVELTETTLPSVPEPATLSIFGLGLVGLGLAGRRVTKK